MEVGWGVLRQFVKSLLATISWDLSTLNLSNSIMGTWCYHITPQEVWERRQKKVDGALLGTQWTPGAPGKGNFRPCATPPGLPLGRTSR